MKSLDDVSALPEPYPMWHQHKFGIERTRLCRACVPSLAERAGRIFSQRTRMDIAQRSRRAQRTNMAPTTLLRQVVQCIEGGRSAPSWLCDLSGLCERFFPRPLRETYLAIDRELMTADRDRTGASGAGHIRLDVESDPAVAGAARSAGDDDPCGVTHGGPRASATRGHRYRAGPPPAGMDCDDGAIEIVQPLS